MENPVRLNILTFNWHEAYICTLAKTGHYFDIVERFKGGSREWFYQTRPLPVCGSIVNEKTAHVRLKAGLYNAIVCHNFKDLIEVIDYDVPKILVFHNKLTTELALDGNRHTKEEYLKEAYKVFARASNLQFVFISQSKKDDWGLDGEVITPGIDTSEYCGYTGNELKALRIGNFMKKRDIMLGFSNQEKILKDIPNTMLGINEQSHNSRFTKSWDDLKEQLRSHRVYLNTTVEGYEDGYNLACLEAMATGMPVVSTYNSTSPIDDGINGYISEDIDYLSDRIISLFEDHKRAVELGMAARKTVEEKFNITDFIRKWNSLFCLLTRHDFKNRRTLRSLKSSKKNILLAYVSYPVTTARYMEDSFRKRHNVTTCGPAIDRHIIKLWKLENMKEEVRPHDIPCETDVDIKEIADKLPDSQYPDMFLWIESVYGYFPKGVSKVPFPTACYMIDSHLSLGWHIEWATQFDIVFTAQREYVSNFKNAGCKNVIWLPLACDPSIHKKYEVDKEYDICFVGSITQEHKRRKRLLDTLSKRFNVRIERSFLEEMSIAFSKAKIVFNEAVRNDLNMRVFEALAAGSMLFTDEAKGSGLTEIFRDREHLAVYNEQNLIALADYYLNHDEEREEIARAGREEVLQKHSYDHRVELLIDHVFNMSKIADGSDAYIDDNLSEEGIALQSCSDRENALSKFCEALDINIENKKAMIHFIEVADELKKYDISERYIARFLELHPANVEMLISLSTILLKQGKTEESKRELEKALMFDPENKEAMEILKKVS